MGWIFDFGLKVVEGLLWPWQCAFLFGLCAFSSAVSLFLWLALTPVRMLHSPSTQKQGLVKELEQMRILVAQLDEKANLERRERVTLYNKLEKALQQRAVLKSRVATLLQEVKELKEINQHVEEEVINLHEAKAVADANVIRASLVVEEYERRLEEAAGVELEPGFLEEKLLARKDLEPDEVVNERGDMAGSLDDLLTAETVASMAKAEASRHSHPSTCPHSTSLLVFAGLCAVVAGSLAVAGAYAEQKRPVVVALACDSLLAAFTSRWLSDAKATAWGGVAFLSLSWLGLGLVGFVY